MQKFSFQLLFWRLFGGFLLLLPFLPLDWFFGKRRGTSGSLTAEQWLLGILIVATVAGLLSILVPAERSKSICRSLASFLQAIPLPVLLLVLLVELLFVSTKVFQHRPLLVDSIVQLFQAEIFAAGRLKAAALPYPEFFLTQHMLYDEHGWYAQYPPGHSAILAIGVALGLPWLPTILLTLGSCVALTLFSKEVFGTHTARITSLLFVSSPFVVFMGASFMNHVPTLFFVSLFLLNYARWEKSLKGSALFLAGATLGAAFLCRPLTAMAIAVPFGIAGGIHALRSSKPRTLLWGLAGGIPVASLFFLYNALTTGDPFLPGYLKLWGSSHGLGFHVSPWGEAHTALTGLRNELTDLSLLNEFLFEWPIPSLLPLALFAVWGRGCSRWTVLLAAAALSVPTAYFFYWHRDSFLGPRFLFSTVAFLLPLSAHALIEGFSLLQNKTIKIPGLFKPFSAQAFTGFLLCLSLLTAAGMNIPIRYGIYATSLDSMKFDIRAAAEEHNIRDGIIFVSVSWGNRLLAALRARGVSASFGETLYRNSDHCLLAQILSVAEQQQWSSKRLISELQEMLERKHPIVKAKINNDPTLRLRPGVPLAPICVEELRYDQAGYTIYTPHVRANTPDLQGPLVIARDMREKNSLLQKRYPGKPAYLFRGDSFEPLSAAGERRLNK